MQANRDEDGTMEMEIDDDDDEQRNAHQAVDEWAIVKEEGGDGDDGVPTHSKRGRFAQQMLLPRAVIEMAFMKSLDIRALAIAAAKRDLPLYDDPDAMVSYATHLIGGWEPEFQRWFADDPVSRRIDGATLRKWAAFVLVNGIYTIQGVEHAKQLVRAAIRADAATMLWIVLDKYPQLDGVLVGGILESFGGDPLRLAVENEEGHDPLYMAIEYDAGTCVAHLTTRWMHGEIIFEEEFGMLREWCWTALMNGHYQAVDALERVGGITVRRSILTNVVTMSRLDYDAYLIGYSQLFQTDDVDAAGYASSAYAYAANTQNGSNWSPAHMRALAMCGVVPVLMPRGGKYGFLSLISDLFNLWVLLRHDSFNLECQPGWHLNGDVQTRIAEFRDLGPRNIGAMLRIRYRETLEDAQSVSAIFTQHGALPAEWVTLGNRLEAAWINALHPLAQGDLRSALFHMGGCLAIMQKFDMDGAIAGHRMLETFIDTDDVPAMQVLLQAYAAHLGVDPLVDVFIGGTDRACNTDASMRTIQGLEHLLEICCTIVESPATMGFAGPLPPPVDGSTPYWHRFRLSVIQEEGLIVRPENRSRHMRNPMVIRFHERYLRHLDAINARNGTCVFVIDSATRTEQERIAWQALLNRTPPEAREKLRRKPAQ